MTDWFATLLSPAEMEALGLSMRVAFWAMVWSLPLAIATAWLLARCRFPGRTLLDGLIHLPLVLPPVVIGYMLLVLLGRNGAIGSWLYDLFGITLAFTWRGAAVASAVVAFPLVIGAWFEYRAGARERTADRWHRIVRVGCVCRSRSIERRRRSTQPTVLVQIKRRIDRAG